MKTQSSAPHGFRRDQVQRRFADIGAPSTYSASERSVEAVLSTGASVRRAGFIERLEISKKSVDLSRLAAAGSLPLLDAHFNGSISSVLGKVVDVRIIGSELRGRLAFADNEAGRNAEELVKQRVITSVSIGYLVESWRVEDNNDNDDFPTFVAERFQLCEVSLVGVPADASAVIRSLGENVPVGLRHTLAQILDRQAAIEVRQRMQDRHHASELRSMNERQRELEERLNRSGRSETSPARRHPRTCNVYEG